MRVGELSLQGGGGGCLLFISCDWRAAYGWGFKAVKLESDLELGAK